MVFSVQKIMEFPCCSSTSPLHLAVTLLCSVLPLENRTMYVDRGSWIVCSVVWVCLLGFVMSISNISAHVRLRFKLAAGLGEPWTRGWNSSRLSL